MLAQDGFLRYIDEQSHELAFPSCFSYDEKWRDQSTRGLTSERMKSVNQLVQLLLNADMFFTIINQSEKL